MARQPIASGTVHRMPADFRKAIESDAIVTRVWGSIMPLARNEWICWVTSAKKDETRSRRIEVEPAIVSDGAGRLFGHVR